MPALFVLLWSSGFTFVALGLPHSEPITFLALRYVIVVAVLAVAFAVVRPPLPRGRAWLHLAIVGLLLQAVYFGLFYLAIDRVAPATVALIVCLQPVLVGAARARAGRRARARSRGGRASGWGSWARPIVILARSDDGGDGRAGRRARVRRRCWRSRSASLYENRFGTEQHPVSANLVQFASRSSRPRSRRR